MPKLIVRLIRWTALWLLLFLVLYGVAVWRDPSLAPILF